MKQETVCCSVSFFSYFVKDSSRSRDKYVERERERVVEFLPCYTRKCICIGIREEMSWFFVRVGLPCHIYSLNFSLSLFSRYLSLLFFVLSFRISFFRSLPLVEIEQFKLACAIREKKWHCICLLEIILSRRIAIHVGISLFYLPSTVQRADGSILRILNFKFLSQYMYIGM